MTVPFLDVNATNPLGVIHVEVVILHKLVIKEQIYFVLNVEIRLWKESLTKLIRHTMLKRSTFGRKCKHVCFYFTEIYTGIVLSGGIVGEKKMKKTIVLCDICSKPEAATISVKVNREMDAAGSMENIYDSVDLCSYCILVQLQLFVQNLNYTQAKDWMIGVRNTIYKKEQK